MLNTPADRKLIASLAALVAFSFGLQAAQAQQFAAPTCVPPNCNPAVIQNIALTLGAQNANINISGDAKLGSTLQIGGLAPALSLPTQNLFYGNVGPSSAGSLMLLQYTFLDRLRITFAGQEQLPLGTLALPSYSFLGDTNSGIFESAPDTMNFVTGGVTRLTVDPAGAVTVPGTLAVTGTFSAASFAGIGTALTSLNASNITSGTLNDARLSTNVPLLNAPNTYTAVNTFSNAGNSFTGTHAGNGAGLTGISATNITTGTLPAAQMPANVAYTNAAQNFTGADTFSNAANSFTGTYAGSGAALTSLNASNLSSGTVADARLSGTYSNALTFAGNNAYNGLSSLNGGAKIGSTAYLTLTPTVLASLPAGANGAMYYDSGTNKFRCFVAGVWSDCAGGGGIGGAGTNNFMPRFTPNGATLGNSLTQDNGTNVGVGGAPTGTDLMTVYGNLTARGTVFGTYSGAPGSWSGVYGVSTVTTGTGVYGTNGTGGAGAGVEGLSSGTYGVKATATGPGSSGVYSTGVAYGVSGNATAANSSGVFGTSPHYGVWGLTPATTASDAGVFGQVNTSSGNASGVAGFTSNAGNGVSGQNTAGGNGVWGVTFGTGNGGRFESTNNIGTGLLAVGSGSGKAIIATGDVQFNNNLTVNGLTKFGWMASDLGGQNGMTYYNTTTNKFRCYENGAWKDCGAGGGLGGSGSTNYIPKFTPNGTTVGNSLLYDNGTGVGIGTNAPTSLLELTPTGGNWNEGIVINPSSASGWNAIFFRPTIGSIGSSWLVGRSPANTLEFLRQGLAGMTGTSRGDAPLEITTNGSILLGGNVTVGGSGGSNVVLSTSGRIASGGPGYGGMWVDGANQQFVGSIDAATMGLYNANWYFQMNNAGNVGINGLGPAAGYGLNAQGYAEGGKFTNTTTGVYALLADYHTGIYVSDWNTDPGSQHTGGSFYVCCGTSSNTGLYVYAGGPSNWGLTITNGGAQKPGGGGFNNYASDRRTKRDVTDFNDGLDVVRKIHPVNYSYNGLASTTDDGKRFVGLIAQDVQSYAPYMVGNRKDFLHKGDKEQTDILTFDASDLTYIEANAIKTLDLVITDFKAEVQKKDSEQDDRIKALEQEVQDLKAALKAR